MNTVRNLSLAVLLLSVSLVFVFFYKTETEEDKTIKIAACPTFHYLRDDLEKQGAEFIATQSTAESLSLLSNYDVDMVLAGRTLKPDEPNFDYLILGNSCCSFVSQTEQILLDEDFDNFVFYTNLEPEEIKGLFPDIKNIERVENVYEFLDNRTIGITLWEDTNLYLASMVHLLNPDGTRNIKSRVPIVYYQEDSDLSYIDTIKEIIFD